MQQDIVQKTMTLTTVCALVLFNAGCNNQVNTATTELIPAGPTPKQSSFYAWMHDDVPLAWNEGYTGTGASITVIDDFTSSSIYTGNLTGTTEQLHHGNWTYAHASLIAPNANLIANDFHDDDRVNLVNSQFNILNLSYSMFAPASHPLNNIAWSDQEQTVIDYASHGQAVTVKAAGNDAIAIGSANNEGNEDYLNNALIGAPSALFVGALNDHGSTSNPTTLAWYSNYAGSNTDVQNQFLVVGVLGHEIGLYGTSFAAPIISGYAAILHSKFTTASPTAVAQQLLDTARTDTLTNYDVSIYGQGEASLSRALAPASIQ